MRRLRAGSARHPIPWWLGAPAMAAAGVGIGLGTGMNATAAAGVFVLAVVGAALMGGLKAGLVASVLSFVGLNYFFTPPRRTFAVEKTEDLVALVVFLAVSVVVSGLFSSVLAERLRAERRELELGRLYGLAQALLEGAPPEATLKEIAEALVEVFGLQRSEIVIARDGMQSVAVAGGGRTQHPPTALPIGNDLGTVLLYPKDADSLSADTTDHVEAFIAQAALALERARLGDEARRARLDSEASELRAALFSAVTHDLKTPLSSIKAAVTGLLDAESRLGREDVESLLETILAEADRLNRLLGNLLDLARAKTGALRPHAVAADLPEILGAVLGRLRPSLARHQVELAVRNDLPEVAVDLVQIDQVLTNLLENAARFAPPGTPIRIAANRWHKTVELKISDRGPGIPADERERVFEPFYRKDRGEAPGGSGLGLAIARAIVVGHGGKMRIEETPGGGTTVILSLPVMP